MSTVQRIQFYTAPYSPYSHRVRLALDEAGADYLAYEFPNTRTKPDWYYQINPRGRIPSIAYGGPDVPPEEPSPESAKLTESLALIEFIADIFPDSGLLPKDPILRAKARGFIQIYDSWIQPPYKSAFFLGEGTEPILQAIEKLQAALPSTGFAIGQYSIADIAVAPFFVRMLLFLRHGIGAYSQADGDRLREAFASEKFARFRQYVQDLESRPSFQKNWDEAQQVELWKSPPKFRKE
ncbi:thioredoxin-like protein [Dichomitus squalens]|uniref:Thioredoxin-like protein n=1 Tax=Dichomitus squalens TaxID=114155 RepID=A0A4Q9N3N7_9APHY|nr:thioredoxin-like protein [Dichomitus squalens]